MDIASTCKWGRGGRVFKFAKVSPKRDNGKDGFGRAFCDDSPFAYIFLRSIRDLQALLIFRAGLLPKFFFFRRTFSSYFYLMPKRSFGIYRRASGNCDSLRQRTYLCIVISEIGVYFPFSHRLGHEVCALTRALAGGITL